MAGVFACLWANASIAQPLRFDIPSKPLSEGLIDFGIVAKLSMLNVQACKGRGPPLHGTYEPRQALAIFLEHAPCRFQLLDPSTVRLAAETPRPAPTPPRAAGRPRPPPREAADADTVVVTASKRRERLINVAGDASVLGAARLDDASALDLRGVAGQLAAVVTTNLGPGRDKLLLRGVSDGAFTGRARSTVATYLDDAPITYNAPDPDLVLTDIDHVEVLRGPQGALYGGGSVGGVLRIVTRTPDLQAFSGALRLRGSGVEGGGLGGGGELTFNAPLLPGRLATRGVVYEIDDPGFLRNDALQQSNVDRTRRTGGRLMTMAALDGWTVKASGAFQRLESFDSQYTEPGEARSGRRATAIEEGHVNRFAEGQLVINGPLGAFQFHSSTSFVHHNFHSRYDATSALTSFDTSLPDLGLSKAIDTEDAETFFDSLKAEVDRRGIYDENVWSDYLVQDSYWNGKVGEELSLTGGVLFSALRVNTRSSIAPITPIKLKSLDFFDEKREDQVEQQALYGEAHLQLDQEWSLTAGARAFRTHVALESIAETPLSIGPPQRRLDRATSDFGVSPKVTLQYTPSSSATLYVLAATGERAPGFNTGGLQAPTSAQAGYGADRLTNFEAGARARFWNGHAQASAAVFHDQWHNIQTDQYYGIGLPQTLNVGSARLAGVEGDLAFDFGDLTFEANAFLNRSKLVSATPSFAGAVGRPLPGIPTVTATLFGEYRRPLIENLYITIGGRAAYLGQAPLTFMRTRVGAEDASYLDAQLWTRLALRRYSLTLNVYNPGNSHADTFAYGNPFSFGQVPQSTPQRPRTFELVASAVF